MTATTFLFQKLILNRRRPFLDKIKSFDSYRNIQNRTLLSNIQKASRTKFGKDHGFSEIRSVGDYRKKVPLRAYENFLEDYFKPETEKFLKNDSFDPSKTSPFLKDIIWPGFISFYCLSSGTTAGTTKFLPLTNELLESNHKGATDSLIFHFLRNPNTRILDGKTFLLGGNASLREDWNGRVKSGDLSGVAAFRLPWFFKDIYFPGKEIASISHWETKMERAAEKSLASEISILAGVPSWVMLFLEALNKKRKFKGNIRQIWPSFDLYVHGGISFEPYKKEFRAWLGEDIYFQEVYTASEAFIGIEDPYEHELRIMPDYGTFYEFVPASELDSKNPTRLDIHQVEPDENYAVVLSTNAGLWSYVIGDTIRFLEKGKPFIKITGRTKFFLSAFGEHLIQEEIETALRKTCEIFSVQLVDYHTAPIFPENSKLGRHQYLIEFTSMPKDLDAFVNAFDQYLQNLNEDYAAHRTGNFGMEKPDFKVVPDGFFKAWMREKGKMGGQNKVPRISNERGILDDMLGFLSSGIRF